jgi:hypothetical protein
MDKPIEEAKDEPLNANTISHMTYSEIVRKNRD